MRSPKKKNRKPSPSSSNQATVGAQFVEYVPTPWQPRWILPIFLVLALIVYVLTLCPTVPGGDSGELISVAYNLSVAHPPGYPLFTMLAHLITYLPMESVAWRVNLLSALFAILSGYLIYKVVFLWLKDRWLGVFAAGLYLFSPLIWRYAVVAEVFTLNNVFIALLLYCTQRFLLEPNLKWTLAWSGTLGLASSHHHTIVFLAVPVFFLLMLQHWRFLLQPKVFFLNVGMFALGFLPYLYLPWASRSQQIISWGDTTTWQGFITHFLRREYGTFQLATGSWDPWNVFSNLQYYAVDLWHQYLYGGVLLIAFALWAFWRADRKRDDFGRILLYTWVFYTLVFHFLANMDLSNRLFYDVQSRFWMLPNLILCMFAAYGLREVVKRWAKWRQQMLIAASVIVVVIQVGVHYEIEDQSRNTMFYDLGKSLLAGVPQNSLIFMRGDVYVNAMRYLQSVEGYRTDVKSIPFDLLWWPWMKGIVEKNFPDVVFPGKVYRYKRMSRDEFTLRDFFDANWGRFPMYIGKLASYEIENVTTKYRLIPIGFLNKVALPGEPVQLEDFRAYSEGFKIFNPPGKDAIRDKSWEAFVYYNYWDREMEKSKLIFEEATRQGENLDMIEFGARILERMIEEYPESPPGAFRNLGVAYQIMSRRNPMYIPKMVAVWRRYLEANPVDDPSIESIRQAVQFSGVSVLQAPGSK